MDDTFVARPSGGAVRHRGLKGVSIGYKIIEQERRKDARYLKQVQLFEISLTPIPANPQAQVTEFGVEEFRSRPTSMSSNVRSRSSRRSRARCKALRVGCEVGEQNAPRGGEEVGLSWARRLLDRSKGRVGL